MTKTGFSGLVYTLCACCLEHGSDPLVSPPVPCVECGQLCSCRGCQAEQEDR